MPTSSSLLYRGLQGFGVLQWVFSFLGLGESLIPLFSLLVLFTSLWWLSVLYLVGLFLGWDTPSQGGRPSEWMRKQTFWKHLSDYSPIKETVELPPNRNYVLGAHPHGIMCTGIFCNFLTESNGFSQRLPGHRPWTATLDSLFRLPVYHGYIMSLAGMCPGNHQGLDFILSQPQLGQAVVIIVGGAHECLSMVPGEHHLTLQEQKGFLHLALRHGAALVSVYSFGENGIFSLKTFATGSWQHLCQITFKKLLGFAPSSSGAVASRLTCVILSCSGPPQRLHPSEEEVDHYHALYMKALCSCLRTWSRVPDRVESGMIPRGRNDGVRYTA
uniref:Acyltransferase n=1 Tax=Equus caballus TaxID=9796 RepID=F7DKQ5_HORSE